MRKKSLVIITSLIIAILVVLGITLVQNGNNNQNASSYASTRRVIKRHSKKKTTTNKKNTRNKGKLRVSANGHIWYATFANNSSARAFKNKLKRHRLILHAHDFGSFEKVGTLPYHLSRNDVQINTQPGDIILYEGHYLTLYYARNSWNFTHIAKIQHVTQHSLLKILGRGKVTITYSLVK